MRLRQALLALIAVIAAVLVAPAPPVWACSCASIDQTAWADNVFVGRVVSVERHGGSNQVQFAVESTTKGAEHATVTLTTSVGEASCGFNFEVGQRYRVLARDGETNLCAGNAEATGAPPTEAAPEPRAQATTPDDTATWRWAYPIGLIVLLGVGGLLLIRRRQRDQ